MAKLPSVRYIWTAEDERIARGGAPDVQGAFVTPYGIPAAGVPRCATFTAGTEVEVDLDRSGWGEPWRARRFHSGKPFYEWHEPGEIPGSIGTLAELCKHLRERDPSAYPETIYGEKKLADPGPENPAKMLFDYWQNSRYRYATVKEGFDWKTYASRPGGLAVRKDGVAIDYVLRKVTPLPKAVAAPGAQKRLIDEPALAVEQYIVEVADATANIRRLLDAANDAMLARFQIIYKLQALRAIAEASANAPQGGMPSQGAEIVRIVDTILPKVHQVLIAMPIRAGTAEQALAELLNSRRSFTVDAVADIRAEERRLRELLLGSSAHAQMLKTWAASVHGGWLQGHPAIAQLVDLLTVTVAEGHLALGECAPREHDDVLKQLLDNMPPRHAETPDSIGGDSPTEVLLNLVGKGTSITLTVVGNLAGPPSLSIALLQVYALRQFPKIVQESFNVLSKVQVDLTELASWRGPHPELLDLERGVTMYNRKMNELTGYVVSHVPDGEFKQKLSVALIDENPEVLAGLRSEYGEEMAGVAQSTVAWKGAMVLFSLLGTALAIREAQKSGDRNAVLTLLDCTSQGVGSASVVLGTYETFLTVVGRLEPVAKALTKVGNVLGAVGGAAGAISGGLAYFKAIREQDWYGATSAMFGAVGSAGMAIFAGCAVANVAMPVLGAISLACILASGAVSFMQVIDSGDNEMSKTNKICHGILSSIRADALGGYMESRDGLILVEMEELEKLTREGLLPNAVNDYWVVLALEKAGLSKEHIQQIVNSSALATTPFGPGPGMHAFR
ncbi:hypothetical protein WME76_32665 [Sorangium sp. So ce119]|uniref:hypothetical protein n=1 Tax=Sorangium sp. So ce119 TaxID=3133279 RepID=UPI003F6295ED